MTHEERAREFLADYASSPHPLDEMIVRYFQQVERETADSCASLVDSLATEFQVESDETYSADTRARMSKAASALRQGATAIRAAFPDAALKGEPNV